MTTCRDVITKGLKFAKVIGVDETPSAGEVDLGLDVLQSLYRSWFSSGEFGCFDEVYKEDDYTALENERVTASTGVTITLPTTYEDSSEEYGDGTGGRRAPFELSAIEVVQGDTITSNIWERTGWVDINSLTLSDTAPLVHYGEAGLAACFAMHYADTFGTQIGAGQKQLANSFKAAFRIRRNEATPPLKMEPY